MRMQLMMMRRALLEDFTHDQRPDPCLHSSIHGLNAATARNASVACHHVYALVRHREGSPIPYLLAGLAAMLALIAISLFILACSYWKLVGCVEQHVATRAGHTSSAPPPPSHQPQASSSMCGESKFLAAPKDTSRLVVIMAGHDVPTFIAQPAGAIVLDSVDSVPSSNCTTKV